MTLQTVNWIMSFGEEYLTLEIKNRVPGFYKTVDIAYIKANKKYVFRVTWSKKLR